jgi:hypothetical protein
MDVDICRRGVIKWDLSAVHRTTKSSQKSEARYWKKEENEPRQNLRGRFIISALLHFSGPPGIQSEIKDRCDTVDAKSYLMRILTTETDGKAIHDGTPAEAGDITRSSNNISWI